METSSTTQVVQNHGPTFEVLIERNFYGHPLVWIIGEKIVRGSFNGIWMG